MSALAAEFPGSLREADDLPPELLAERLAELAATLEGGPTLEWMERVSRFHTLARGALVTKRWLAGRRAIDGAVTASFDAAFAALDGGEGVRAWRDDLAAVASPPRGRMTTLVFERMARECPRSAAELRAIVFGARWTAHT